MAKDQSKTVQAIIENLGALKAITQQASEINQPEKSLCTGLQIEIERLLEDAAVAKTPTQTQRLYQKYHLLQSKVAFLLMDVGDTAALCKMLQLKNSTSGSHVNLDIINYFFEIHDEKEIQKAVDAIKTNSNDTPENENAYIPILLLGMAIKHGNKLAIDVLLRSFKYSKFDTTTIVNNTVIERHAQVDRRALLFFDATKTEEATTPIPDNTKRHNHR